MSSVWNEQIDPTPCELNESPALRRAWMLMVRKVEEMRLRLNRITRPDGTIILDTTTLPPTSFVSATCVESVSIGSAGKVLTMITRPLFVLGIGPPTTTVVYTWDTNTWVTQLQVSGFTFQNKTKSDADGSTESGWGTWHTGDDCTP